MGDAVFSIVLTVGLFVLGYFAGSLAERKHFISLRKRELKTRSLIVCNFTPQQIHEVRKSVLVTGSVVVSLDYFKRILAGLRFIFGGRVKSYESLLDRARREALMRMKEQAIAKGCQSVINVRIETSSIASKGAQKGNAGVEVLAFGTALQHEEIV